METQQNFDQLFFQETQAQGYQPLISMRGLHIDISRHFIPLETILKITDIMSRLQLNTLHLHLSDDQGFPIELKSLDKFPNSLQNQLKAQQQQDLKKKILTIKDQEILLQECKKKNIEIIPEIDVPGHSQAFLSMLDANIKPATQMGIVTNDYIDIEKHLPILMEIFEELVIRFQAKYFHMGGDEAQNFKDFEKLIQIILQWAQKLKIQIIAWDEVITAVNWGDNFPFETLIIQQWRKQGKTNFRQLQQKFPQAKLILSQGYYLDHVQDPISIYSQSPQQSEIVPFGCIACTWTELIDDKNIFSSIFPVMYVAAYRWYYFPQKFVYNVVGELLYKMSEWLGYYDCEGFENSWKCRHWYGFYSDQPRSTTSLTIFDELNREQDKYPVFSKGMIKILYYFEKYMKSNNNKQQDQLIEIYDESTEKMIIQIGNEAIPKEIFTEIQEENLLFILRKTQGWKIKLKKIVESLKKIQQEEEKTLKQLSRNGFIPLLQYCMGL